MAISLGNTPESWGIFGPSNPDQVPWDRCLDEIAEAGYEYVELGQYGYLPTNPQTLRAELDKRGLKLTAATVVTQLEDSEAWQKHEAETVKASQLAASVGAEFLVMIDTPYSENSPSPFTGKTRLPPESWHSLVQTTSRLGQLVKERYGLRLTFHPCGDSYVQYEDQIEALLDQTNPDFVSLCLDTGHHSYSQGDPVAFMRRHYDRIPYIHIKSVSSDVLNRSIRDGLTIKDATKTGVFCEPHLGAVDFEAFANVLSEVDYHGIALVEQDLYRPPPEIPIQVAKRARNHFLEAGIV